MSECGSGGSKTDQQPQASQQQVGVGCRALRRAELPLDTVPLPIRQPGAASCMPARAWPSPSCANWGPASRWRRGMAWSSARLLLVRAAAPATLMAGTLRVPRVRSAHSLRGPAPCISKRIASAIGAPTHHTRANLLAPATVPSAANRASPPRCVAPPLACRHSPRRAPRLEVVCPAGAQGGLCRPGPLPGLLRDGWVPVGAIWAGPPGMRCSSGLGWCTGATGSCSHTVALPPRSKGATCVRGRWPWPCSP